MSEGNEVEVVETEGGSEVTESGIATFTTKYNVKSPEGKATGEVREATCSYRLGKNLQEAVELFGEGEVFEIFFAKGVVNLQARVRALLANGLTQAAIQADLDNYKLGDRRRVATDVEGEMRRKLAGMSQEERAAYLQRILNEI